LLDVIVMFMALGLIIFRYRSLEKTLPDLPPMPVPAASSAESAARGTDANVQDSVLQEQREEQTALQEIEQPAEPAMAEAEADVTSALLEKRNIGFSFRHSKAKKVQIIGDFNNWVPQPLKKGKNYIWKITLRLAPGEYAYNFVVDGKPIRDPYNQKICNAGRGFTNSYLKVNPAR
ncbi:MAG TPA: glycogen-binding domain-containing protein, partial [bacterium]|nr:glycogen-binding domain-containing protein [bacterium]